MSAAATSAPPTHPLPSTRNARCVPPADASHGSPAAAAAPPIGTAVCRMPRARPSWSERNQPMIARPLAALTLAPRAPAAIRTPTRAGYDVVQPAPASAAPAPGEPDDDHPALVEAVGEQSPRKEREEHSDADRPEHDAGLAERQPVVRAQRRRERGQPGGDGGEGRLRERARAEDHPARARAWISFAFRTSFASGPLFSGPAVSSTAGRPCRRWLPRKTRALRRAALRRCSHADRGWSRAAQPSRSRAAPASGRDRLRSRPRPAARRAVRHPSRQRLRRRDDTSRGTRRAEDGGRAARRWSRARRSSGRSFRLLRPSSPSAATSRPCRARVPAPSRAARARVRSRSPSRGASRHGRRHRRRRSRTRPAWCCAAPRPTSRRPRRSARRNCRGRARGRALRAARLPRGARESAPSSPDRGSSAARCVGSA